MVKNWKPRLRIIVFDVLVEREITPEGVMSIAINAYMSLIRRLQVGNVLLQYGELILMDSDRLKLLPNLEVTRRIRFLHQKIIDARWMTL